MRRRDFITSLGGAAALWPIAARAQQATMPVIGYVNAGSPTPGSAERIAAFHRGLASVGYMEGRNVAVEHRWGENQNDRLPTLIADLVRRRVAVIACLGNTQMALVAKAATKTIPVVFAIGSDPVEIGLVASLNRPGGNVTGVSQLIVDVAAKRLEMLHQMVPMAGLIALLVNPANPVFAETEVKELQRAALVLGVRLLILNASRQGDFGGAFATLVQQGAGALMVSADSLFTTGTESIVALAAQHRVPTMFQFRESAVAGGLVAYGSNLSDMFRLAGVYVGRILKGEKPADLPVEQATKIELVINLKTAKAFGITVPLPLLAFADEVIE